MLVAAPQQVAVEGPLVFLAGPIAWGPDAWHDRAIALITALDPDVHVASPRRDIEASARLWNRREDATGSEFPEREYDEQLDWETRYLRRAAAHGVVMFWLAR